MPTGSETCIVANAAGRRPKMIQTDLSSFSYKKGSLVPACKRCGAQRFYRDGKNARGLQRYECRDCNYRFVWTSDLPRRRTFSHIMSFAVQLYTDLRKAVSLRGIAELLHTIFDVSVSCEAIRQWILAAARPISRREIDITWHADETYIKIQGKGHWLWIVRGRDSGHVLAWHLSATHLLHDAMLVLRQALQNNQNIKPMTIITDGLWQYPIAIYKVMRWTWKEQKTHHIQDSGIGKNAFIERLNKEIKRRIRWFSTFQSIEGAHAFFSLWFTHFNQRHLTPVT